MKHKCGTCEKLKHDTCFNIKEYFDLDLSKCLDCQYPNRWDEVNKYMKETYPEIYKEWNKIYDLNNKKCH